MPYPRQYTDEQREKAYMMFWHGRDKLNTKTRATYTGKQISAATGVSEKMVYRIAHEFRKSNA